MTYKPFFLVYVLLLVAFSTDTVNAQNLIWAKPYTTERIRSFSDINPAGNDRYLTTAKNPEMYIYKLRNDTDVVWKITLQNIFGPIVTDHEGNFYLASSITPSTVGGALSVDFNPGQGIDTVEVGTGFNFIAKYDSSGTFKWVKKIRNSKPFIVDNMTMDVSKNIVLSGSYITTAIVNFDPDLNAVSLSGGSGQYCAKYDSTGKIQWVKEANMIGSAKCNYWGDIYSSSAFLDSIEIQPGSGKYTVYAAAKYNHCVVRYTPQGNVVWGKAYGCDLQTMGLAGFDVDAYGNVYSAGYFVDSIDIDPGPGVTILKGQIGPLEHVGYLLKLDSSGNFVWGKKILELGPETVFKCKTNMLTGEVYVGGTFVGIQDFDPGPAVHLDSAEVWGSSYNFFIAKYNKDGNFLWVINTPGGELSTWTDFGNSIICGGNANDSVDVDPTVSGRYVLGTGLPNAVHSFVVKYATPLTVQFMQPNKIDMRVYPNPVSATEVTIDFGQKYNHVKLFLSDITGKVINNATRNNVNTIKYDVGEIISGTYLLNVSTENGSSTVKLIKN